MVVAPASLLKPRAASGPRRSAHCGAGGTPGEQPPAGARIVRALLAASPPVGVRDLAQRAGIDAGYVSRVLELLNDAALVERGPRGRLDRVDRGRLLRRWAADAPLEKRGEQAMFLEPRGLSALVARLKSAGILKYAVTGSLAAQRWAPVAPPRLAQIYVDSAPTDAAARLELRPTESGANVQLIRPRDGHGPVSPGLLPLTSYPLTHPSSSHTSHAPR
jgi:hypothetical protein